MNCTRTSISNLILDNTTGTGCIGNFMEKSGNSMCGRDADARGGGGRCAAHT